MPFPTYSCDGCLLLRGPGARCGAVAGARGLDMLHGEGPPNHQAQKYAMAIVYTRTLDTAKIAVATCFVVEMIHVYADVI